MESPRDQLTPLRPAHPLAGKTVAIKSGKYAGQPCRLEDWWQNVSGRSWTQAHGNFAAIAYAFRGVADSLPLDDEVVYGKIGAFGHLLHASELGEVVA